MSNNFIICIILYIFGVIISSIAQLLLKKSTLIKYNSKIKEYLNFKTMFAYFIFFTATIFTVISYKGLPLSLGPILGTTEYVFVAILGRFCLKEKITSKKMIGLTLVLMGIFIYFGV